MKRSDLRDEFDRMMRDCGGVLIKIDGTVAALAVPSTLRGNRFVLDYDRFAAIPIPDLETTEHGIRATLSFSRTPIATFVPWSAVVAMAPKREPLQEEPKRPKLSMV